MRRPRSPPYDKHMKAPCVLASRRPSHPDDEAHYETSSKKLSDQSLLTKLGQRRLGLLVLEAHAAQHLVPLAELDLVVLHDLDAVAERIEEVEASAGEDLDAGRPFRGSWR